MKEREIFIEALQKEDDRERSGFLDEACGDDAVLRASVQELLAHHQKQGSFFLDALPAPAATECVPIEGEAIGSKIGPYRLRERIAEGGMGIVYVAEQTQPVSRKVALKVIKPGMDTRQVIARFEAERQALAMMEHPNIARVLDAGSTDSGRPYFVMDLVRGVPVTEYCDEYLLTTRERLELFVTVCQAIQHAHQKGIIHRDIKPGNVLVTRIGDEPVAKVIDFGVAKAVNQRLTERTIYTHFNQMIGTPLYMSPEQAEMSDSEVDTRSDVYSLGVLLYELLTGTTPFERETLNSAGFDEIRRMIREDEPPRPSDRISTLKAEMLSTVSQRRKCDPRRLGNLLRGELDWIVTRALEKDPKRRYASASGFAEDLQRYLANEPVQACPPSWKYRFAKFSGRNRAALTTAILVGVTLFAGITVSVWQAWEATASRREGESHFVLARAAVDRLLTRIADERLLNAPGMEGLRTVLLTDALEFYKQMAQIRTEDPALRLDVALAEDRLGSIYRQLGDRDAAQAAHKNAVTKLQELCRQFPKRPEYTTALADALLHFAESLRHTAFMGGFDENREWAENACRQAIDLLASLVEVYPNRGDYKLKLVDTLLLLVHYFDSRGEPVSRMTSLAAELVRSNHTNVDYRFAHAQTLDANARTTIVPTDVHRERFDQSLEILEELVREHRDIAKYREWLADVLWHKLDAFPPKQRDHLAQERQRVLEIYEGLAIDFPDTPEYRYSRAGSRANYAIAICDLSGGEPDKEHFQAAVGQFREAERTLEELLRDYREFEDYLQLLRQVYLRLRSIFRLADDYENVLATNLRLLRVLETVFHNYEGTPDTERAFEFRFCVARARYFVAENLAGLGKYDEAIQYGSDSYRECIVVLEKASYQAKLDVSRDFALFYGTFSKQLFAGGYVNESREYAQKALELCRTTVEGHRPDESGEIGSAYETLAYLLVTLPYTEPNDLQEALKILAARTSEGAGARLSKKNRVFVARTTGLAHFRASRWNDAIKAINKCIQSREDDDAPAGAAIECFIMAMACWHLERHDAARQWLEEARTWRDKTNDSNRQRELKWELGLLASEAEELIGSPKEAEKQILLQPAATSWKSDAWTENPGVN